LLAIETDMRTIVIPPYVPFVGPRAPRVPVLRAQAQVQCVVWIPPLEPFNPLADASDELLAGLFDQIEVSPPAEPTLAYSAAPADPAVLAAPITPPLSTVTMCAIAPPITLAASTVIASGPLPAWLPAWQRLAS
jgi:hypothetical protein